jgi:transposase
MDQEKQKINSYSAEFMESLVNLALESEKPIAQTARDLGVNTNTLHRWISKYSRPLETSTTVRTDEHLYEELKRLKKENARLIEERDLLKKAAGDSMGERNSCTWLSLSICINGRWSAGQWPSIYGPNK